MPGNSCISQLLCLIHEIQSLFDYNPAIDVRTAFSDISEVSAKV